MFKQIDNLVNPLYADEIERIFGTAGGEMWCYNDATSPPDPRVHNKNVFETFQLTNSIVSFGNDYGNQFQFLKPLFFEIEHKAQVKIRGMLRVKANMMFPHSKVTKNMHNTPHVDVPGETEFVSAIYYVNQSDGDTVFFNEKESDTFDYLTEYKRVAPKKNSLVMFDSHRYHASSNPIKVENRVILNLILQVQSAS